MRWLCSDPSKPRCLRLRDRVAKRRASCLMSFFWCQHCVVKGIVRLLSAVTCKVPSCFNRIGRHRQIFQSQIDSFAALQARAPGAPMFEAAASDPNCQQLSRPPDRNKLQLIELLCNRVLGKSSRSRDRQQLRLRQKLMPALVPSKTVQACASVLRPSQPLWHAPVRLCS